MNCQDVVQLGVAYLNGEVSASERKLIQLHLEECQHCQCELAALSVVQTRISQSLKLKAAQAEPSPQAWSRLQAKLAKAPKSHGQKRTYRMRSSLTATARPGLHPAWEWGLGIAALVLLGIVLSLTIQSVSQKSISPALEVPFNLTQGRFEDVLDPAWSPDGHRLAFAAKARQSPRYHLYLIRDDRSELFQLTSGAADDRRPRWSADGTRIGFISTEQEKSDLALINPDSSSRVNLTHPYPGNVLEFAWSPKGAEIAYVSGKDGKGTLFLISNNFSGFLGLAGDVGIGGAPVWSPDGCNLLFSALAMDGAYWGIHKSNNCGHGASFVQLTGSGTDDRNPQWYPDGKSFLYESGADIYTFRLEDSDWRKLIAGATGAALSPDGSLIAFRSPRAGSGQLFISAASPEGESWRVFNRSGIDDLPPVWSPDSQRLAILAHSKAGSGADIFIVRLQDFVPWRAVP